MNAEKRALIQDILAQENRRYIVPIYQRAYKWTEEECSRLVRDILKCSKRMKEHFVGSVVYQCPDKTPNFSDIKLHLVDGQQRLTTMLLITKALNLLALSMGKEDSDASYVVSKTNRIIFIDVDDKQRGYKILPSKRDADVFNGLISADSYDDIVNSPNISKDSHLYNNFIKAYSLLSDAIKSGMNIKSDIYDQGMLKLTAVEITLDYDEDAQEIFESINSLGVELSNADLIRNYLLMSNSNQEEMYTKYWEPMQDTVIGEKNMESFVQNYLYMKKESVVNDKNIYKEYVLLCEQAIDESSKTKDDLLKELYDISLIYEPFIKESSKYSETTNQLMQELRDMNQSTAYPFLMRVFLDRKNRPEQVSEDTLNKVINLVIVYLVRRTICGVPTNSLRGFLLSLYRRVFKITDNFDRYYEAIYAYLRTIRSNDYLRTPEEVDEALETAPLYNNLKFATYLLFKLENGRYPNVYSEMVSAKNPTVEHIMPQTLTDEWIRMLDSDERSADEIQRKYLNTLGNLSLSSRSKNSVMSNEEFGKKKEILKSDGSKFSVLNKDVIELSQFTENEIIQREKRLAEILRSKYDLGEVSVDGIKFEENVEIVVTLDANEIFIGAQPIAYSLLGKEQAVDSYAQIVTGVAKQLLEINPDKMRELASQNYNPWNDDEKARKCIHYKDEAFNDAPIGDGIYVNTTYQANYSIQFCAYMMQEFGIDADQLMVFLKKASIKKEHTISKKEKIEIVRKALKRLNDEGTILYDPTTMPRSDSWIKFQTTALRELFTYSGAPISWDGEDKHQQVSFLEYNMARHKVVVCIKVFKGTTTYIQKLNLLQEEFQIESLDQNNYWHLKLYPVDFKKAINSSNIEDELVAQLREIVGQINIWINALGERLNDSEAWTSLFTAADNEDSNEHDEIPPEATLESLNRSQSERITFWTRFQNALKESGDFNPKKVTKHHYCDLPIGNSRSYISITLINNENYIGVSLYIPNDKALFDKLYSHKQEIENAAEGVEMTWMRLDEKKASRVRTKIEGLDFDDHANYDDLISKTIDRAVLIRNIFTPYIS